MDYLANTGNIARTGSVSVTAVTPSNAIEPASTLGNTGSGIVTLTGDYTGTADATFTVEIVNASGAERRVSVPTRTGVGNAVMSGLDVDNAVDAQTFTVTLEDLGTLTRAAFAPFGEVNLKASAPGEAGNLITLSVSNAGLIFTASDYSVVEDMQAEQADFIGEQFNFGALTLTSDGYIAANTPRISFGSDPTVYRPFRRFENGRYVYSFSPTLRRNVAAGTAVKIVTGSRTVTITDGSTTNTLTGIVTYYDCLREIRANSTLIEVDGLIANERRPGGAGVVDLNFYTAPFVASLVGAGTRYTQGVDIALAADATAPTETLVFECRDISIPGREVWAVTGTASRVLTEAITGELYAGGPYTALIPRPLAAEQATANATISVRYDRPGWDGVSPLPGFCPVLPALGPAARNGQITFTYQRKPVPACDCTESVLKGNLSPACLGTIPDTEDSEMTSARVKRRMQRIAKWLAEFIASNTSTPGSALSASDADIEYAKNAASIAQQALIALDGTDAVTEWPELAINTAYTVDTILEASPRNGYRYAVTVAGTTGGSLPTFPTTVGDTVTSGGVTIECVSKTPFGAWDDAFAVIQADAETVEGIGANAVLSVATDGATFTAGQLFVGTASPSGLPVLLRATTAGTFATPPSLTVDDAAVLGGSLFVPSATTYDGLTPVAYLPLAAARNTAFATGARVTANLAPQDASTATVGLFEATTGGTTHASVEPVWPTAVGGTVSDGTVTWTRVGADTAIAAPLTAAFYDRYNSAFADVLAGAEITPDFLNASTPGNGSPVIGDGCWQDQDVEYWWVSDDDRAPLFTNIFYHSARNVTRADGATVSLATREFAFGPRFGCENLLEVGDRITVSINGVNGVQTYQQGDTFVADIIRATPLGFHGGQTGEDELTFSVVGSVDGALAPYVLDISDPENPNAYSDSGVTFTITPGSIASALGDAFSFSVEAAQVRWKKDAGSFSSATDLTGTLTLSDGLTATFTAGDAPSWVPGDVWVFTARAVNGPANMLTPQPSAYAWGTSTQITVVAVDPEDGYASRLVCIHDHTLPSDVTITLQGSNDSFVNVPLNTSVPWSAGTIQFALVEGYAAFRLLINRSGSIRFLYIGAPFQPTVARTSGLPERGRINSRTLRLPSATATRRERVTVEHAAMSRDSAAALVDALAFATENDASLIAVRYDGGVHVVTVPEEIELNDAPQLAYQTTDVSKQLLSVALNLEFAA